MTGRETLCKREPLVDEYLPYSHHVTDEIVALDTGALMLAFRVEGVSFETANPESLATWKSDLNTVWRNIADDRLAIWQHTVRREDKGYPEGAFHSDFARRLDARYRDRVRQTRLFVNELYLTVVLYPGRGVRNKTAGIFERLVSREAATEALAGRIERLEEAGRDLQQHLGRYGLTPLSLYTKVIGGHAVTFSAPMEMLALILHGRKTPAPLVRGHFGASIYTTRLIFGREAIELRDVASESYAGILGIREYPASTWPGMWNNLLSASFAFVASQSFAFIAKPHAVALMTRKQNQMRNVGDRALSQMQDLDLGLDDLMSGRFVMGEHQFSLLVHGETLQGLAENMSKGRSMLAESGMAVVREDLGLEAAFWGQFPGHFRYRVRPAAITSLNFASFAPLHTYPAGKPSGNHWGEAVALLRTSAASPYYFSFHVGDIGHTFVCGPTGSGKTVVQNFMLAQLEKLGAQQVFFDKDRGAEIFVRASGGAYLALRNGTRTGCAPFMALQPTPENIAFLRRFVRALVRRRGEAGTYSDLAPADEQRIDAGIDAVMRLPAGERTLSALRPLLGQSAADGIGARFDKWCRTGSLSWVFDNPCDAVELDARLIGFDMTDFLDDEEIRTPLMMYLFHRVQALIDGRPLVIDIDEFWKALGDEAFRSFAQDGLKTFRKRNAMMVFGTQSPSDVTTSPIARTIIEQCPTKIYMPNDRGRPEDYIDQFGLSEQEFRLIREELTPESRRILVKQGKNSVVAELNLQGLDDDLAVLSGRAQTVELLDQIRAAHGDDPATWLPLFTKTWRTAL